VPVCLITKLVFDKIELEKTNRKMENVLEKDITGHRALKSICALLLGGTANLLWTNPSV
jgi:hypothetical protein